MRWKGRRSSRNIEDRRMQTGRRRGGKAGGIGGVGLIAVLVIGYFLGIDVTPLLQSAGGGGGQVVSTGGQITQADQEAGAFVSVVLADTEEVWDEIFQEQVGRQYNPATLVPRGRFTAPRTARPIWIPNFSRRCRAALARRVILLRPMSLPMRSRTMSRTSWAFWVRPTVFASR